MNNNRYVLVASVMGENENYFAVADATGISVQELHDINVKFAESASKYFRVDKQYCTVERNYANSVAVVAAIESNNRADGYFKDMDKKCFEFLMDAVKSVQSEEFNKDLANMLGELAKFI